MEKDFLFVEKLKKGDYDAYTLLMNNYYKNLCGYANLFTKDPSKSEDIVQNVFVMTYIFSVLRNCSFVILSCHSLRDQFFSACCLVLDA